MPPKLNVPDDPQLIAALELLVQYMGANKVIKLAEFVDEVCKDSGFGNVRLSIIKERVFRIVTEKSYE